MNEKLLRTKMMEERNAGRMSSNLTSRLATLFTELRKQWKPVMRHYFTERHKTPVSWYRMRLNYARSLAVTSVVGHIVGLGDRHTSNILMDNGTGEVVHIDLGIAFEQVRDSDLALRRLQLT